MKKIISALTALALFAAPVAYADDFIDWTKVGYKKNSNGVYGPPDNVTYVTAEEITAPDLNSEKEIDRFSNYAFSLADENGNEKYALYPYYAEKGSSNIASGEKVYLPLTSDNMSLTLYYGAKKVSKSDVSSFETAYSGMLEGRKISLASSENSGKKYLNITLLKGDAPNINALYDASTHYVSLSAECSRWYKNAVNVTVLRGEDAIYANQFTAENGSLNCEFELNGTPSDCTLVLSDESGDYESSLSVYSSGAAPHGEIAFEKNGSCVTAALNANNAFYGSNDTHYIAVAFYGEGNSLLSVYVSKCRQNAVTVEMPQNAVDVKAFVLDSLIAIKPLTESKQLALN